MDEVLDINVTKDCISCGVREDYECCPIGLAFRRAGVKALVYGSGRICIFGHNIYPPKAIEQFISDFDKGIEVKPFNFKYNRQTDEIICEASLSVYEQFPVRG